MTAEYPPTYYMLAEAVVVIAVAASVLIIGKRVRVTAKRMTLRPYILLQMGVLMGEEVLIRRRSVVVQVGIVRV